MRACNVSRALLVRRLLRREDHREIEKGVCVIWVERSRRFEFRLGSFLPTLLAGGDAEIIVCSRVLWVDRHRFGQFVDRFVVFALAVIDDAERAVRKGILGRNSDRLFEGLLRQLQFARAKRTTPRFERA